MNKYGLFLVFFVLGMTCVFAQSYYDSNTLNITAPSTDSVCFGFKVTFTNLSTDINITAVVKALASGDTKAYIFNGTYVPGSAGACNFTDGASSHNLANATFGTGNGPSNASANISGGLVAHNGETWSFVSDAAGVSRSNPSSGSFSVGRLGNSTKVQYQCSYYTTCQTINMFVLQGIMFQDGQNFTNATLFTLQVNDLRTNTLVSGFGWNFTNTNASDLSLKSGYCPSTSCVLTNTTGTLTISIFNLTGYIAADTTKSNYLFNLTSNYTFNAYQSLLNVSVYQLFTNNSIINFNITNGVYKNSTPVNGYAIVVGGNTSNIIQTDIPGNYTKNTSCTNNPLQVIYCSVPGIYDDLFTISAKNNGAGISSFTLNVTNTSLGGTLYSSTTTNGSIIFPLLQGYWYNFMIVPVNSSINNATLPANASTNLYNFTLQDLNTISITFVDENNGSIVTTTTISLNMYSDQQSLNSTTTNGTIYLRLLQPATYLLQYSATNYSLRNYQFTLTSGSFTNLQLPMLLSGSSTSVTVTVVDSYGNVQPGVIVKLYKKDINTNSYLVNQIFTTDQNGQGIITAQLLTALYYFSIEENGVVLTTTTPAFLYSSTVQVTLQQSSSATQNYVNGNTITGIIRNNSQTMLMTFSYNDPTNTASSGCLYAYQYAIGGRTLYNTSCINSSSGSTSVTIANITGTYYVLQGVVTSAGNAYLIATLLQDFQNASLAQEQTDKIGLFTMFLVIITVMFFLRENLRWMVIMTSSIPFLFSAFGFIAVGIGFTAPIFLVGIVVGVVIGGRTQ